MLNRPLKTDDNLSDTILRVALGLVIFPHGGRKLPGWFGGHGLAGAMRHFTEKMGIPSVFALLAVAIALAMIISGGGRWSSDRLIREKKR